MLQSRNAVNNLIARYKSVLKNCHLVNTFGSLAAATLLVGAIVLGGADVASAYTPTLDDSDIKSYLSTLKDDDGNLVYTDANEISSAYTIVDITDNIDSAANYYKTFTAQKADDQGNITSTVYGIELNSELVEYTDIIQTLKGLTTSQGYTISGVSLTDDGNIASLTITDSNGDIVSQVGSRKTSLSGSYTGDFIGLTHDEGDGGAIWNKSTIGAISGDFIGNSAISEIDVSYGGAISNWDSIGSITGKFINNTSGTYGGAVMNYGTISSIDGIFIENTASLGSAISNGVGGSSQGASIGSISGDFINNKDGSAIVNVYDASTIGSISGNFIGNSAFHSSGGAIFNYGSIDYIIANFTGNYADGDNNFGSGGAIYNYDAQIGTIIGNFVGNYAFNGYAYGGAIDNQHGSIDIIIGDFLSNYTSDSVHAYGGALSNFGNNNYGTASNARISSITGNFISNSVTANNAYGGAIVNMSSYDSNKEGEATATIDEINGSFIANHVNAISSAYGGAIYNVNNTTNKVFNSTISSITGDFIDNYAFALSGDTYGGAIYNTGIISTLICDFTGNYASGTDAFGGAIYTEESLTFYVDDTTNTFSNNYTTTDGGVTKNYNAIYVGDDPMSGGDSCTLTFSMNGTGDFVMNDSMLGTNDYLVNITGNNTGEVFYLNDEISGAGSINVSNATLELGTYVHDNDSTTLGSLDFAVLDLSGNSTLSINSGKETINLTSYCFDLDSGESLLVKSGTFDVANCKLTVASGGSITTEKAGILIIDSAVVGYDYDDSLTETTATLGEGVTISNEGLTQITGFDGLSLERTSKAYTDMLAAVDAYFTGTGVYEFADLTVLGATLDDADTDDSLGATNVEAGTVEKGKTVTVAGVTGVNTTINEGMLTLTGRGDADEDGVGILAEGEIKNNKDLTLGSTSTVSKMEATLTNNSSASTTTLGTTKLEKVINNGTFITKGDTTVTNFESTGVGNTLQVDNGASFTASNLSIDKNTTILVGTTDPSDSGAVLAVADPIKINGASIFIDPAWSGDDEITDAFKTALSFTSKAALSFTANEVDGHIAIGQNSYLLLGGTSTADLTAAEATFVGYGLTWGEAEGDITAALFLNEAYTVSDSHGSLYVDGTLTAKPNSSVAGTATFADQSLLAVNTDNIDMDTAALTAGTITAKTGASLLIASTSMIFDNDEATVTVATGTNSLTIEDSAWGYDADDTTIFDESTIYVNSSLMKVVGVTLDATTNTYIVTVSQLDANDVYVGMDSGLANQLNTYTDGKAGKNGFIDKALGLDSNKVNKSLESATTNGASAGVGFVLGNISNVSVNNVQTRTGGGSASVFNDTDSSRMLAMNGDGSILPVDNNQEGLGVWFMPMYKHTSVDGFSSNNSSYGFDTDLYGATLGADYTFASLLRLGMALSVGCGESDSTGDFYKTKNDFDYYGITAYAGMSFGKLTLSADFGYTASDNEINQDNAADYLTADAEASLISTGLKTEYRMQVTDFNVTPYAGVRLNYYDIDSFNSKMSDGSRMHTKSSDYAIVEFPLGVTFDTTMEASGWDITPSLGLGVKFAAGDLDPEQRVAFTGSTVNYAMSTEVADPVTFQGALALGIKKDVYSIDLGYTLDLSENVESHGINLLLRYEF